MASNSDSKSGVKADSHGCNVRWRSLGRTYADEPLIQTFFSVSASPPLQKPCSDHFRVPHIPGRFHLTAGGSARSTGDDRAPKPGDGRAAGTGPGSAGGTRGGEDTMTIMHLGRKRFVLTFRVESDDEHRLKVLERLHQDQRMRQEDLSRRTWWELEQVLSRSRSL